MKTRPTTLSLTALLAASLLAYAPLATTAHAQANTVTTSQTLPLSTVVTNCNGEPVTLTGNIHLVTHYTQSSSGSTNFTMHSNYEEAQGTGQQTLVQYRGVSSNTHKETNNGPTPQTQFTTVDRVRLISQGATVNLIVNVTVHTTVNSNGEATSTVATITVECNG